jgi:transposase
MYFQLLDEINALDPEAKKGRKRKLSNERALHWVLFVLFNGISWSACLEPSVDVSTIRRRCAKWMKAGIFANIRHRLTTEYLQQHPDDCKNLIIDATFVKDTCRWE